MSSSRTHDGCSSGSYLFVFRAYPDVDHMAPLAWKLLTEGEEVHAVISPGYDAGADYRLQFLLGFERFHVHVIDGAARRSLAYAIGVIARHRVRAICVEWGYGFNAGYERLRSARGILAVARSAVGSVRHRAEPSQTRVNFMVAARLLGRAVVCLPHGLSIKLDVVTNDQMAQELGPSGYDWSDRNRFHAYVLNTEHNRTWHLENAAGDPQVMQTWGSLRWAPEWFELNRRLAPRFAWPLDAEGRVKVVFMVPKWANRLDKRATLALIRRLSHDEGVSLAIKGHARPEDGSSDPLRDDPEIAWDRIADASHADSVSLIEAADVVIDVGSSIGLEVVMQDTVLVNPAYLHELTTFFDTVTGSCVVAQSADQVFDYLRAHAAGERHRVTPAAREELLRQAVYGSRPEPFDVIATYSERVRELATG